ncbi:MAG: hypothetical protein NT105_14520 [Verrucomicrobia bacterium]|nr:hypothetical protein [Verrucomicrobiota bacterium]
MNRPLLIAAFSIAVAIASADTPVPTHQQTRKIGTTKATESQSLSHFCLNAAGDIVACDDGDDVVRVITMSDQLKATWKMPFAPHAIAARADGTYVVTGPATVALLSPGGKILKTAELPVGPKFSRSPGAAVIKDDIFVCSRAGTSFSVFRFNKELGDCKEIIRGLRGCCGCQDIGTDGKDLYVVENARHHVLRLDRDGNKLGEFGKRDPDSLEGYGGCCEPKNICFGSGGTIYTAESNNFRVKRWSANGKCTLVALVKSQYVGCTQVAIATNKDGSELYFLDKVGGVIHVLTGPALGK